MSEALLFEKKNSFEDRYSCLKPDYNISKYSKDSTFLLISGKKIITPLSIEIERKNVCIRANNLIWTEKELAKLVESPPERTC